MSRKGKAQLVWTAAEDVALIAMAAKGMDAADMLPHLPGRSIRGVGTRLTAMRKAGRAALHRDAPNQQYDAAFVERVRELRAQGVSRLGIAAAVGIGLPALISFLHRYKAALNVEAAPTSAPAPVKAVVPGVIHGQRLAGSPEILRYWREDMGKSGWFKLDEINDHRRRAKRAPFALMGGSLSLAGRGAWA